MLTGHFTLQESSLPERPEVHRADPVTLETLRKHLASEHAPVSNEGALRSAIFHGGLTAAARPESWKFLLGYRW